MTIRIARTIFVALVGLSVAMLPATIGFAASAATAAATEISASETMPDCDHHHSNMPSGQTKKTAHDGACMASCALTCFSFTATGFSGIAFSSPAGTAIKPIRTSNNVSSRMGDLPFRPPRS